MGKKYIIRVKYDKCHHFWHFMMGEFLPICYLFSRYRENEFVLYNPHRKWGEGVFDSFFTEMNVDVTFSNSISDDCTVLDYSSWEYKWVNKDEMEKCKKSVEYIKTLVDDVDEIKKNTVLVQYRGMDDKMKKYFKNARMGSSSYGADKRQFLDVTKLHLHLDTEVVYVNSDGESLLSQVKRYNQGYNNILLEHGAGMVFILFMEQCSNVVEIITPQKNNSKNGAEQGCRRLCYLMNNKLHRIVMENRCSVLGHIDEIKKVTAY